MKTIFTTSRRKKIRTRKSLNEIRKRSRQFIIPEIKHTKTAEGMGNNQKKHHFVTSNRLTLAMFPNAVQSETVTRFSNDEVKKKINLNFKDLLPNKKDLSINNKLENRQYSDSDNSIQSISDDEQKSDEGVIYLESTQDVNKEHAVQKIQNPDTISPLMDTTPQTCIHEKYYLYEQFMSEISPHLKKNVAKSLLSEDVIDNLKRQLLSIKIQSSNVILKHKPTMSDIHLSTASEEMMMEDPMGYIRLSYSAMQNSPAFQSDCSSRTSDTVDSLLHIHSPQDVLSSSSRTDLSDTPEYIYFPHKLN